MQITGQGTIRPGWERSFRAMGTHCHVIVEGGTKRLLDVAQSEVDRLEGLWSRFRDDSEISRLNARGRMVVGEETADLLAKSALGQQLSGGLFDPFLADEIVAAGYGSDFSELEAIEQRAGEVTTAPQSANRGRRSVLVAARHTGRRYLDRRTGLATLPTGYTLDSGGLGKGLAADRVVRLLRSGGAAAALVNLGGDLRTAGHPGKGMWQIGVNDESGVGAQILSVNLSQGGLATSSVTRRRWRQGDHIRHHLLDPRTGQPATARIASATAICESAWLAEVLGKAALLSDPAGAQQLLGRRNAAIVERCWDGEVEQRLPGRH